jgi:signal transduction histidine kinase
VTSRAVARTGLPAAVLAGAVLVGARVREARRLEQINRGLHELRRPLQALALEADHRAGAAAADPPKAPLELAICALTDLDHAVNGGPRPSRRKLMRARPVVEAAVQRWSAIADPPGEAIGLEWRAGTAAVVADPDRIAQALDNLLANAFEHGTPPVRVAAITRDRRLRITVEDRGRRAATAPRRSSSRRHRGVEIVAETARAHGGRFTLEPGPAGTIAAIELPLASLPAPSLAAADGQ